MLGETLPAPRAMTVQDPVTHHAKTFAILLASPAIGGEERFLVELAIAMQRTSTRPMILNLKSPMPYELDLQRHGVELQAGIANRRFDVAGLFRLVRLLRRTRPDVLLINSNRQAMVFGGIASFWCHIPVVLLHTHEHQCQAVRTMRLLVWLIDGAVGAADRHCAYLRSVVRLPHDRVARIYPGVNLDRIDSDGEGTAPTNVPIGHGPVVGIVAALRPEKDHETFLKAAAIVTKRIPEVRFLVIGDGPRRAYLEGMARDYGVDARVQFLGWQRVDAGLLSRLDLLVLSSLSETFPAVILEAFGAGVPVVATDVGSVAELFGLPPCGILVPPRNPAALAHEMVALLNDRARSRELASAAAQRVRYFSADRFCRDMLMLAQGVASAKADSSRPDLSQLLEKEAGVCR